MAIPAAISLTPRPASSPTMQATYTAGDANKITMVNCAEGIWSVDIDNQTGATLLIQTVNAVQDASVASTAEALIQTGRWTVTAAMCNRSPFGAWSFGVASAGAAVAKLTATAA